MYAPEQVVYQPAGPPRGSSRRRRGGGGGGGGGGGQQEQQEVEEEDYEDPNEEGVGILSLLPVVAVASVPIPSSTLCVSPTDRLTDRLTVSLHKPITVHLSLS